MLQNLNIQKISKKEDPLVSSAARLESPPSDSSSTDPVGKRPRVWLGLPLKLLLLTGAFVLIAEILIFLPSLANFRVNWLNDRIVTAQVSALAADAFPSKDVPPALRNELLRTALVRAIAIRRGGARRVILPPVQDLEIDVTYDLRVPTRSTVTESLREKITYIGDALQVLYTDEDRTMRIIGLLGPRFDDIIEIVMPQGPLRRAMVRHGTEIFWLSFFVAVSTAALVYFSITKFLVKPIRRLSRSIVAYSENPEDPSNIIKPSGRSDEIGLAEFELSEMQQELSQLLKQKTRLAQLGLAVSKINHDLRNMLANTQIISDRLVDSPDPTVQKLAPKLIASLDKAINFCNETLRFGRRGERPQQRELFFLRPLVEEMGEALKLEKSGPIQFLLEIEKTLEVDADREQLFRIFSNLCGNALHALHSREKGPEGGFIKIEARRDDRRVLISVSDNGPGIPPAAREKIFQPFRGSTRRGGTGLGLPISAELAQEHGGSLRLVDTEFGTTFELEIPDSVRDVL